MKKQQPKDKLIAVCGGIAEQMGYELCDISFDKEPAGLYIRMYLDKEGGISLDDCEKFHRRILPLMDNVDYDFLEVCSLGIDRPVKTQRDIEKSLGKLVEVKLYKAADGQKVFQGRLASMDAQKVTIQTDKDDITFSAKEVAQVRLVPDLSALDEENDIPVENIIQIDE